MSAKKSSHSGPKAAAAAATPSVNGKVVMPAAVVQSSPPRPLPLLSRPIDLLLAFWFVVFAFTTTFTDLHNFVASWNGVTVDALEKMHLVWPPAALTAVYFKWARTVDPLLLANPMFWQCIEWVNMAVLTPFAVVAVVGVLRGVDALRVPAIVVSSFTHYSLILCIGTTLFGDARSADPAMFSGVYQLYLVFPLVVIARLAGDRPFATRLAPATEAALWAVGAATFAVFFAYVAKWLVVHFADALPSGVLTALEPARALP